MLSGCGGTKLLFNNRGPGHYKLQVTSGGRKKLPLTVCVSQSLSSDEEGLGLKYLKTNEFRFYIWLKQSLSLLDDM